MNDKPVFDQLVLFLYTADLPATAAFYEQLLGLPLALDQGVCRIYRVSSTGFVGFCQQGTAVGRSAADPDGVILTLVSEDVDGWYNYLQSRHVPIEKPPTLNEKFNIYHLFLRDPNGYLVEIQRFLDPQWGGGLRNAEWGLRNERPTD
ncbi:MAG: VOC family protein [Chloroflexi bacterium]|nr:VOC family protein [Chloroflexota bacterium]